MRSDRLRMPEPGDDPSIHQLEETALRLDGGVGRYMEEAAHLPVAGRRAVTRVPARALLRAGARPHPGDSCFAEGNVFAVGPTSAMICCAESTPRPGTSANRSTAPWCGRIS